MIRQLAHLNFVTNDLSRIIDFYVNKLGMSVKFALNNSQGEPFGYYFGCGNTTFLEFFDQAMAAKVWGGKSPGINIRDSIQAFLSRSHEPGRVLQNLEEPRVSVTDISMGMDHSRQAWVADPDGNQIELMEYGPDSLQLISS